MGEYLSRHFCRWRDGRGPSNNNQTLVLDTLGGLGPGLPIGEAQLGVFVKMGQGNFK